MHSRDAEYYPVVADVLQQGATRPETICMTYKTTILAVLLCTLCSCGSRAECADIRISRERSNAEASDPEAFEAYQQRMTLRRVARSPRLTQFYLDLNDGSEADNGDSDAVTRRVLRRQGGDGQWYGWRWVAPYVTSQGAYVAGHYERIAY